MRIETDWRAVLAAVLCGVAVAMNIGKVPIVMTQLRTEFGLSLVAAGWVSSMINTLAVASAIFFGLLGDRLGALRMCYAGLAVGIAGGLLGLVADSEAMLLVSRFAEGASVVAVAVSAPALVTAAAAPLDRRFALGIWSAYMPAGIGLVMLLSPLLLLLGGWRGVWGLTLGVLFFAAWVLHRSQPAYRVPSLRANDPHPFATARDVLLQPLPWLLSLTMLSWTLQHYALIVWLPTFLKEQRDLGAVAVALLSCLMVLVNVPGNLLGGRLLQRNYRRGNLIAWASAISGLAGVGIFLEVLPDLARYALCLVLSFSGGLIPASVLSATELLARTPKQIGTLQGLMTQMANIGPFVGAPLIAAMVAASGRWGDALWVTGSAALVGVALGLVVRVTERRPR